MAGLKCAVCDRAVGDNWYGVCSLGCLKKFNGKFPGTAYDNPYLINISMELVTLYAGREFEFIKEETTNFEKAAFPGVPPRFILRSFKGTSKINGEVFLRYIIYVPKFGPGNGYRNSKLGVFKDGVI